MFFSLFPLILLDIYRSFHRRIFDESTSEFNRTRPVRSFSGSIVNEEIDNRRLVESLRSIRQVQWLSIGQLWTRNVRKENKGETIGHGNHWFVLSLIQSAVARWFDDNPCSCCFCFQKIDRMVPGAEEIRHSFDKLCLDLNMDKETSTDAWTSYKNLSQHYLFQGDQIHWLAVSLYISCRRNDSNRKSENNPISIDRLLKSANNLSLIEFFDKLHKWEDMSNLPEIIRSKLNQLEKGFHLSSCVFQKYPKMFKDLFGGNEKRYISHDYSSKRKFNQINPKYNNRTKTSSCSAEDFFPFGWTLFALSKTIYPSTSTDLVSSFHLLISTFQYLYSLLVDMSLDDLLQGSLSAQIVRTTDEKNRGDQMRVIELLCSNYGANFELSSSIYQEHFRGESFKEYLKEIEISRPNVFKLIREIDRSYDEIVLRNCIIDERIFLDRSRSNRMSDVCSSLNENRNQTSFDDRTPLTANQHFISADETTNSSRGLTPISQYNLLIQQLDAIINSKDRETTSSSIDEILQEKSFIGSFLFFSVH